MRLRDSNDALYSPMERDKKSFMIRGNYRMLERVFEHVRQAWRYWLSRRSHKGKISWEKYEKLWTIFPLPRPRIIHAI